MAERRVTMYSGGTGDADARNCRLCGVEISAGAAATSGVCDGPECHAKMIEEAGAAIIARKRAKHAEASEEVLSKVETEMDAAHAALDAAPGEIIVGVMPWQNRPLEPLPPERLAAFREHLDFLAEFAFRDPVPEDDLTVRKAQEPEEQPEVLGACGTCQGMCCKRGGDTALLLPSDFARYRQRNPEAKAGEIIDLYASYLPERSAHDACVYQAAEGCALPRELRQDICNSYYCDSLRWLRQEWQERKTGKAIFVAANEERTPKKVAILNERHGYREIARPGQGGTP